MPSPVFKRGAVAYDGDSAPQKDHVIPADMQSLHGYHSLLRNIHKCKSRLETRCSGVHGGAVVAPASSIAGSYWQPPQFVGGQSLRGCLLHLGEIRIEEQV